MTLRLFSLLVLVAALSFGVRLSEIVMGASPFSGAAFAQQEVEGAHPPEIEEEHDSKAAAADDGAHPPAGDAHALPENSAADAKAREEEDWRNAMNAELEFSPVQMEMFEDLSRRRKELDAREKELALRQALLEAAQRELEQKYQELATLRGEINDLLGQHSEEEEARIASLVKIYEGMKAKDAARIFNTLDTDVLLQVLGRMSERKSAPVIASMDPERARSITILLAEQKRLPGGDGPLESQ